MNFVVTDRQGIKDGAAMGLDVSHIIISISDPRSRPPAIRANRLCRGVLQVAFHDAEPSSRFRTPPEIRLMTADDAQAIWGFVLKHRADIRAIVVHCEAGMSRSPAVAAALCRALGDDDRRFFQDYVPNRHVYRLILRAAAGGKRDAAQGGPDASHRNHP